MNGCPTGLPFHARPRCLVSAMASTSVQGARPPAIRPAAISGARFEGIAAGVGAIHRRHQRLLPRLSRARRHSPAGTPLLRERRQGPITQEVGASRRDRPAASERPCSAGGRNDTSRGSRKCWDANRPRLKPLPRPPFGLVIADRAEALADFIGQAGKLDQRADQAIMARRHLKPVLAPEVDQGFPRGFAHRGVVHLLRISSMLTREKIKIARIRKSMGICAKATREKIRADLNQKREELRAQLEALPANATGQREKIASDITALTRLVLACW